MNHGGDDINKLGVIRAWNYNEQVPFWPGRCGKVGGTSGELWYPTRDDKSVKIFAPDLCRYFPNKLLRDTHLYYIFFM